MDTNLDTPNPPITMLGVHTFPEETTITFYCHDKTFRNATAVDSAGNTLFRVAGMRWGTSWSWRRKVYDSTNDRHLYDFRHESLDLKNRWIIEDPAGKKLASLVHQNQITTDHSVIDATIRTQSGEDVVVNMRPRDRTGFITTVFVDGVPFAVFRKMVDNTGKFFGDSDKTVWEIRVAPNVDLSMVMVMALCRAEMSHVWKQ